jgi:hypothetical protein
MTGRLTRGHKWLLKAVSSVERLSPKEMHAVDLCFSCPCGARVGKECREAKRMPALPKGTVHFARRLGWLLKTVRARQKAPEAQKAQGAQ